MTRQTMFQAKKESQPLQTSSLFRRQAAQTPVEEREAAVLPVNLGRDFSGIPFKPVHPAPALGPSSISCPFTPQRCPFGGACHACPPKMQAKLKIGQPGDRYEQEADRVAEQVMRMPEPQVQRKCSAPGCKDEEEKKLLQTKSAGNAGNAQVDHPLIQSVLSSPGQPLDAGTRSFMEPRFGQDFSGVRVHVGGQAAESARAVNARAYTVGRDVVFGEGQYAPGSDEGRRLVAHELVHVGQQHGMVQKKIQRQSIHNPLFPCTETAFMPGHLDFFGTLVHLAIEQHYISKIDPMAGTEYIIPGSGGRGGRGRADIVDSSGGVYEIKPLGLVDEALTEAENYVLTARTICDPHINWHLGTFYFPPAVPMVINDNLIVSWLHAPGVIAYTRSRRQRVPERVPVRVPRREPESVPRHGLRPVPVTEPSTYTLILEWARRVIESGANATEAAEEFLRQNPNVAPTILALGVAGIIALAADDMVGGFVDDTLIPVIVALMRVAWRFV